MRQCGKTGLFLFRDPAPTMAKAILYARMRIIVGVIVVATPLPSVIVAATVTRPVLKNPPPYNVVVAWRVVPSQMIGSGPPDVPLSALSLCPLPDCAADWVVLVTLRLGVPAPPVAQL